MTPHTSTAIPPSPDAELTTAHSSRVAGVFNSAVASFAVAAAWQVGALDELRDLDTIDSDEFADRKQLDRTATRSMFTALSAVGFVARSGTKVSVAADFEEVYRDKAFFHWLTIGCAELFAAMPHVLPTANRVGKFYRRDAAAIGYACRDINKSTFDPVFRQAVEALDFEVTGIADLGCGSGGRLAQLAATFPAARAIGVDIAASALADATQYIRDLGFGDRIDFVEGDARALDPDPRFADVQLLTCFMMGHDFWPREQCVESLRRLRTAFPHVRRFLLGDTARTSGIPDSELPVFTLAFEVAHDLMGAYLPTLEEWQGVFAESGWTCVQVHRVGLPAASVLYELA